MGNKKKNNESFYAKLAEEYKNIEPLSTTITMTVDDIKTEDIKKEVKSKQEYDKLINKVYWYLYGLYNANDYKGEEEQLYEIEDNLRKP